MGLRRFASLMLVFVFCSFPVYASAIQQNTETFRQVLFELFTTLEDASVMTPNVSNSILDFSEAEMEAYAASFKDKDYFINLAQHIIKDINYSKNLTDVQTPEPPKAESVFAADMLSSKPFPPDYPPDSGAYKRLVLDSLRIFGLLQKADDRCDTGKLASFNEVYYQVAKAAEEADEVCKVAGCDPIGIVCASVCGVIAAARVAVIAARMPLDLCEIQDGNVDGAEIEAAYENSEGLIYNLNEHDTDIKDQLDRIEGNQNAMEELQLEGLIADPNFLVILYLPERKGGKLEKVYEIVMKRIQQAKDAGVDVRNAQSNIENAIQAYFAENYQMSYKQLKSAYDKIQY